MMPHFLLLNKERLSKNKNIDPYDDRYMTPNRYLCLMSKVRFNLKDANQTETLIFLIYRYDGKRLKMSTDIKINPDHWNHSSQRISERSGFYEYPAYNVILRRLKEATHKAHSYFRLKGEIPSTIQLKSKVEQFRNKNYSNTEDQPKKVLKFIEDYIENSEGRNKGTIQGFSQLKNVISKMDKGSSLEFKDLDEKKLEKMKRMMVTHNDFKYAISQIDKIQRKLITIVNIAHASGIYEINRAFLVKRKNWRVKLRSSDVAQRGLAFTPEELRLIENVELSERLDKVRDIFLMGINTGQRFSDFNGLSREDIVVIEKKPYWDIIQHKTGAALKIPVNSVCQSILEKHNGYPPQMSLTKFNLYIKEVCKAAEINEYHTIQTRHPLSNNITRERFPKWQLASSHDCRRTLATLMNNKGLPLTSIKRITGHKSIRELEKYLKIDDKAPISDIENLY